MAQTFYIEADEEIISVVGRLRHASETEVVLVVPKNAILAQSVVSLKLLEREAKKNGKHVIVISQDNNARSLAEKAGLETRPYQEEMERREKMTHHTPSIPQASVSIGDLVSDTAFPAQFAPDPKSFYAVKAENIGSEEFYQAGNERGIAKDEVSQKQNMPISEPNPLQLRVRDNTPKNLTALNSKIVEQEISAEKGAPTLLRTPEIFAAVPSQPALKPQERLPMTHPPVAAETIPRQTMPSMQKPTSSFFRQTPGQQKQAPIAIQKTPEKQAAPISHMSRYALFGFSSLFIILVSAFGFFLLQSKAEVSLLPYSEREETEVELKLVSRNNPEDTDPTFSIPFDFYEENIEVSLPVEASGEASKEKGSDRARGKIIIYNNFGDDPQTLVSTTRFETSDGKIFRLAQGVVVPGMSEIGGKKEPGAIEASIVADQPGSEYNIPPASFTIPGFKGGPKFEKFTAKSTAPMSGGGNGDVSGKTLTVSDIERARAQGKEKANESLRGILAEKIASDARISDDGMELTLVSEEPNLIEGMSANDISVRLKYTAKVFSVSEKDIRETIDRSIRSNKTMSKDNTLPLVPNTITINTIRMVPDFKNISGKAHITADVVLAAEIDRDAIAGDLIGMPIDQLEEIIRKYPQINKINLEIQPEYFIKSLPSSKNRINIQLLPPEPK